MIEVGTLLFFAPPRYASGQLNTEYKKRIMLVIEIDNNTNLMTLMNISSLKGKPRWFTYKYNYLIKKYNPPLQIASFAKLNDNYIVEYNSTLNKFIYKNGIKIDNDELSNIIKRRKDYMKSNNIEQVIFSSEEIIEFNK